ncbi:putative transmembrane transcriptional regulator (anti-sigma factor) [Polaromonas sp. CF318]|uniref:anti-sigma factor family protein n=1 Tax=Polaromonas sp. CF318 TaxID=1144318 RepID=UPI000270F1F3|nr:anti-sigma factor [Polaromonas sp. CF318]EJL86828.1 putative transmembrane transcriptional regulator (anti-sigma factor) [Polaromonas sp. CF318]
MEKPHDASHAPQGEVLHDRINALVDGRLPTARQAELEAQLGEDTAARETLQAWTAQREALRALHRPLLDEAIPDALLAAARRGQAAKQHIDQWRRWGGMAAAVVLAFSMGWLSHGQPGSPAPQQLASARSAQSFVRQASLAHAVFSPEVRHPVEVTAAQQEHLVQWLSKRVGRPLKVPVLAAEGYELVGGRLLSGDGGARAQFMFQNAAGLRLTLYLGAVDAVSAAASAPQPPSQATQETAFRYSGDGPVPSFYWVDQGFGYALSGAVSRDELMKLAQRVYQQL